MGVQEQDSYDPIVTNSRPSIWVYLVYNSPPLILWTVGTGRVILRCQLIRERPASLCLDYHLICLSKPEGVMLARFFPNLERRADRSKTARKKGKRQKKLNVRYRFAFTACVPPGVPPNQTMVTVLSRRVTSE